MQTPSLRSASPRPVSLRSRACQKRPPSQRSRELAFVLRTTWTSIAVQLATGLVIVYALATARVAAEHAVVRSVLLLEAAVQGVEFLFYLYVVRTLSTHSGMLTMAARRYADWFLTTPVMLFTLATFFTYEGAASAAARAAVSLGAMWRDHAEALAGMLAGNLAMLAAGLAGELGALRMVPAALVGFAGFAAAFGILWAQFASRSSRLGRAFFWVVAAVWAVYGVAFLFPPHLKNATYNGLDLVAKNFFGVYLSWKLLSVSEV
jgi:bacteriorhodopsin